MNTFTATLHIRGWKLQEACLYWGMTTGCFHARVNNPKYHNQLKSMCNGIPIKGEE